MTGKLAVAITALSLALPAVALGYPADPSSSPAGDQADGGQTPPAAVAASSAAEAVTVHRDGSKAEPFVADLTPAAPSATDGFDWTDAAVGAGMGAAAVLLALTAAKTVRIRRRGSLTGLGSESPRGI